MDAPNHGSDVIDLERGTGRRQHRVSFTTYVIWQITYHAVPICGCFLVIFSTGGVLVATLAFDKPIPHGATIMVASMLLTLFIFFCCGRWYLHFRKCQPLAIKQDLVDGNDLLPEDESNNRVWRAVRMSIRNFTRIFSGNTSHSGDSINTHGIQLGVISEPIRSDTLQDPAPTPGSFERASKVPGEGSQAQQSHDNNEIDWRRPQNVARRQGSENRRDDNNRGRRLPPRLPLVAAPQTQRAPTPFGRRRARGSRVSSPLEIGNIAQSSTIVKKNNSDTSPQKHGGVAGPRPLVNQKPRQHDNGLGKSSQRPSILPPETPGFLMTSATRSVQVHRKPPAKYRSWSFDKPQDNVPVIRGSQVMNNDQNHEAVTYRPAVPPKPYYHSNANLPSGNNNNNRNESNDKLHVLHREAIAAAADRDRDRGNPKQKAGPQNALGPIPNGDGNDAPPHGNTNTHRQQQHQHQHFPAQPRNPQFSHWSAVPEPLRLIRGDQNPSRSQSDGRSRADNRLTKPGPSSHSNSHYHSHPHPHSGSSPYGHAHATISSGWLNFTNSNSLGYISQVHIGNSGGSGAGGGTGSGSGNTGGVGRESSNGPQVPQEAVLAKEKRRSSYIPYRPPTYCQDNDNFDRTGGGRGGQKFPAIRVERLEQQDAEDGEKKRDGSGAQPASRDLSKRK